MLLASLIAALVLLPVDDAPSPMTSAVGVLTPPPVLPQLGRGFAMALATQVNGCSKPVEVKVVAAGSAEYWADYRAATRGSRQRAFPFVLVLPRVAGALRVGLGSVETDLTDPLDARFAPPGEIRVDEVAQAGDRTIVAGRVLDWPQTLLPLMATFRANWLAPRGLNTCYLRLPPLAGSRTATAVVSAVGGCAQLEADYRGHPCSGYAVGATPYVSALQTSHAISIVSVRSGEVTPDLSVPPPPTVDDGNEAWTCVSQATAVGRFPTRVGAPVPDVVGSGGGADAYSLAELEGLNTQTCRAVAVISENSATYSRDLLILLIGAIVGLGLTLVVTAATDAPSTKPGRQSDTTPPPSAPAAPGKRA